MDFFRVAEWRRGSSSIALTCLLALVMAPAFAFGAELPSTPASEEQREQEEWFYGQRLYGLGYIPPDALAKAVAQRDRASSVFGYKLQSYPPTAVTNQDRWFALGPAGINSINNGLISGRIPCLAIDPRNPSTVYVAAAGGGVWKSPNRGITWSPISDRLPSLASGAVAVDPFSGDVWYGTGELNFCRDCYYGAGVYRTADGGANWTRVNPENFLSTPTSVIAFDRKTPGTLFIGRATALWKSADGGQSWKAVLQGVITDFVFHPLDSSIAYAALGNYNGSPDNGIYRTSDAGQTWTRLTAGLPAQSTMGRIALAVSPASPSTVYALIARSSDFNLNGLYRSLDGGNTWSLLPGVPADLFTEEGEGQGLFNLLVAVDPRDDAVLYAGGSALWKSTDHGGTWKNLNLSTGLPEDPRQIVFDPSDPQTFYLTGDSGVWRSSDKGQSFVSLNNTLAVTQFQSVGLHPTNANRAVGGTQDNGTVLYGGGAIWEQGRPGDSGAAFYDAADPNIIYAVARRLSFRRSLDGGKTFSLITQGLDPNEQAQFYPPFIADPSQPGTLYFGTQRVWQSLDRGEHWAPSPENLTGGVSSATITALAVAPSAPYMLYAGTSNGLVHVSRDGGKSWSPAGPIPDRFVTSIAIYPGFPDRAIIGLSGFGTGHVLRTDNRGGNWKDISSNLPDIPVNAVLMDATAPEQVYVGTDIGVFRLAPDGSWTALQEGMPNAIVLALSQNPATGLLVAATHGRGVFGLALGETSASARAPRITALFNAAGLEATLLAPGMVTALLGSNLAAVNSTPTSTPLPLSLADATVTVNGIPAPLLFVSPTQITFQTPYESAGTVAEITLRTSSGSATLRVPQAAASPGIFLSGGAASIFHQNGAQVSDVSSARVGEELVLYASGLGAVEPAVQTGFPAPFSPPARTTIPLALRVAGLPAEVRFSGLAPGQVGIYQVHFVVPAGVSGKVPVVLEMNSIQSNAVLLSVAP